MNISYVDVTAAAKSVIPVFRQWPINRPSLITSKLVSTGSAAITEGSIVSGDFSNKVAVVAGGSRGIGREIAAELARAGTQTVIVSSSAENLAAASKSIAAAGPVPLAITADLRTLDGCQHVFDSVKDRFDRCDILVCSAGATRAGNFTELPDQAWIDGYALKFFGCVRMCRLFWPMLKVTQGCVVNIGGGAARSPGADFSIGA
jgi:3-oxoacyl-[acyl-carrier protein] reductase